MIQNFTASMIAIGALLLPSLLWGGSSTHSGDYIRMIFLKGRKQVKAVVASFDVVHLTSGEAESVIPYLKKKDYLVDVNTPKFEWVEDIKAIDKECSLHACACVVDEHPGVIFLEFKSCKKLHNTPESAGHLILHEIAHMNKVFDEDKADLIADAFYESWENQGGQTKKQGGWIDMELDGAPIVKYGASVNIIGEKLLVWGGEAVDEFTGGLQTARDGSIYDFKTDQWNSKANLTAAKGRAHHSSIWTGQELMTWGGLARDGKGGVEYPNWVELYDLDHGWKRLSSDDPKPSGRVSHATIWNGRDLVVWGGMRAEKAPENERGGSLVTSYGDGGVFDTTTKSWTYIPGDTSKTELSGIIIQIPRENPNAKNQYRPKPRFKHSALFIGDQRHERPQEFLIWGGQYDDEYLQDGWIYHLNTKTWKQISQQGAPSPRTDHCAVWTGLYMLIWGGLDDHMTTPNDGGIYDPREDKWYPLKSNQFTPNGRMSCKGVWTGQKFIVWGGAGLKENPHANPRSLLTRDEVEPQNTGGILEFASPEDYRWVNASRLNFLAPEARFAHTLVWLESSMLTWGGLSRRGFSRGSGALWFPE